MCIIWAQEKSYLGLMNVNIVYAFKPVDSSQLMDKALKWYLKKGTHIWRPCFLHSQQNRHMHTYLYASCLLPQVPRLSPKSTSHNFSKNFGTENTNIIFKLARDKIDQFIWCPLSWIIGLDRFPTYHFLLQGWLCCVDGKDCPHFISKKKATIGSWREENDKDLGVN